VLGSTPSRWTKPWHILLVCCPVTMRINLQRLRSCVSIDDMLRASVWFIIFTPPSTCPHESTLLFSHLYASSIVFAVPYLHLDHSWPTPPGEPRWRQTTRASWTRPDGGCWHCVPSCQPFASCFPSPSRKRPISSAAGYAASGPPAASPDWALCPAAAAPGSAPDGWPWRRGRGTAVDDVRVEGWSRDGK